VIRGAAFLAAILGAGIAAAQEPGPPAGAPLVTGVAVRAPAGVDPREYESLVRIRAGEPLSERAVRRSLQRLFELDRFANVSVMAGDDGPGRVQLTFVLEPGRPVAVVTVSGRPPLLPARTAAAGLLPGSEYSEDRVDAALAGIRTAYARAGFEHPDIRAEVHPASAGMHVELFVDPGQPTRVAAVQLTGDTGGAEVAFTRLRPGDVFDRTLLAEDLDALRERWRAEQRYRARVDGPLVTRQADGRVTVTVPAHAGPRFEVRFRGNRALGDPSLRTALAYRGEELLDRAMVDDLARRIEVAYRRAGYPDAHAIPRERATTDGSTAVLLFQVAEGLPLRVRRIRFEGNHAVRSSQLVSLARDALEDAAPATSLPSLLSAEIDEAGLSGRSRATSAGPRVPSTQVWDEEAWRVVPEAVTAYYRDRGFLDVQVQEPRVEIDEPRRTGTVTVQIDEGSQTVVGGISFPGAKHLQEEGHGLSSALDPGDPLSLRRLEEMVAELRGWYGEEAYLYAAVELEVERPPLTPTRALVRLKVNEGPRVRVGRVLVKGNDRTLESVVKDTITLEESEPLASDEMVASQQRLMRLGIFRSASVRTLDDVAEEVKDVVVDVRERPGRTFEVGGGVSIADGPRAFATFLQRNLLGSNLEFTASAKVNYQVFRPEVLALPLSEGLERKVDLGLHYPRLYGFPLDVGSRLDLIHEQDINPAYTLRRWTAQLGFDWRITPVLTAGLTGELESYFLQKSAALEALNLSLLDLNNLRFPDGTTQLAVVRPGLTLDLRDDHVEPHSGLLASSSLDLIEQLAGSGDFVKAQATLTGYVPLARRWTLALSAGGGKMFPLVPSAVSLPPKRFYLGGVGSLRGFSQDGLVPEDQRNRLRSEIADCRSIVWGRAYCSDAARALQAGRNVPSTGGDLYALGRGELRFPIFGELRGAAFLEAGNLWSDPGNVDLTALRSTAGAGIRYGTPVGPLALDLGFNLQPDRTLNESSVALHFAIGLF
jgi:outer membrane protein insertion porin family